MRYAILTIIIYICVIQNIHALDLDSNPVIRADDLGWRCLAIHVKDPKTVLRIKHGLGTYYHWNKQGDSVSISYKRHSEHFSKDSKIGVSSPCFSTIVTHDKYVNINTSKSIVNGLCTYVVQLVDSDKNCIQSDTYVIDEISLEDALKEMDGFQFIPGMSVFGFNKPIK
jgi:hypothetical protein